MNWTTADRLTASLRDAALAILFPPTDDPVGGSLGQSFPPHLLTHLFAVVSERSIQAVAFVEPLAGQCATVWGPRCVDAAEGAGELLVRDLRAYLARQRFRLVQAFDRMGDDADLRARIGFRPVTEIVTMVLSLPAASSDRVSDVQMTSQADGISPAFGDTLMESFEGSLDCPEWNGRRTREEMIDGHLATAADPARWYLAERNGVPVGLVILADGSDAGVVDLAYLGVRPEFRAQGVGRALVDFANRKAEELHASGISVLVDLRNAPAIHLYQSAGFDEAHRRQVFLLDDQLH